uniref:Uncharacterized protein n=1 Tax=Lepeophtheirus salmonis TaxID=72036 RepID=A0A0K2UCK6_LEPSM
MPIIISKTLYRIDTLGLRNRGVLIKN